MATEETFATKEEALKVIRDLRETVKQQGQRLETEGTAREDIERRLRVTEEMVEDQKKALRTLSERDAGGTATSAYEGEGALKRFVVDENARTPRTAIKWVQSDKDIHDGGLLDSAPSCDWQRDLQESVHQRTIVRAIRGSQGSPETDARILRLLGQAPSSVKRIFADSSGIGAEFIPDVLSPRLFELIRGQRKVAALFPSMPMPKELRLPYLANGYTPYKKGTVTADDPGQYRASDSALEQRSITAVGLAVRTQVDEDAAEDSIIAYMPIADRLLVSALVDGEEDWYINGDSTATHQDTIASWNPRSRWASGALGAADDHRRLSIGLRARATDVSATVDCGSKQTFAGLMDTIATMDAPHGTEGDVVILTSHEAAMKKMWQFEQVLTREKYGDDAVISKGELMRIARYPIIISDFVTADLNASGIYDNTTKTKSAWIAVNRQHFIRGERRGITVESSKDITRGVFHLVATMRGAFFTPDSSTHKNVAVGYNLL